jgi:hypothetical protein
VLTLNPITLREASAFVAQHHRHHKPPQGALFAISAVCDGHVIGVCIVGRPVARMLADDYTAEVTRLATLGDRNCCSFLYSAAWRACRAMGYRRLVTYILDTEPGTSLRAAGWKCLGTAGGGSWSRKSRPRFDDHPTQQKIRWEMSSSPACSERGMA